jgi:hypothetical protein
MQTNAGTNKKDDSDVFKGALPLLYELETYGAPPRVHSASAIQGKYRSVDHSKGCIVWHKTPGGMCQSAECRSRANVTGAQTRATTQMT